MFLLGNLLYFSKLAKLQYPKFAGFLGENIWTRIRTLIQSVFHVNLQGFKNNLLKTCIAILLQTSYYSQIFSTIVSYHFQPPLNLISFLLFFYFLFHPKLSITSVVHQVQRTTDRVPGKARVQNSLIHYRHMVCHSILLILYFNEPNNMKTENHRITFLLFANNIIPIYLPNRTTNFCTLP